MNPITLTVRKIGNSLGLVLGKEAAQLLDAQEGQTLVLTRSPEGVRLTPYDPEFEQKMKIASSIMTRYKNALRKLAE